jgi:hypothetical protein
MSEGVRKSSRKRIKLHPTPEASTSSNDFSAETEEDKPVRKQPTKVIKRKGKLAVLLNMPLDILFEVNNYRKPYDYHSHTIPQIFGHLFPMDILNLARTTKEFRHVLMHRSSRSIWKAACANVPGLPACPSDMSEPQWVHLVYVPCCNVSLLPGFCSASVFMAILLQICFTTGIRNVDWQLRIRICSKCAKEQ